MATLPRNTGAALRLHKVTARRRSDTLDVETHIQEDLTGEVDALTAGIFDLLKRRGDLADEEITEDMVQQLREIIFFASMNGAREMVAAASGSQVLGMDAETAPGSAENP